MAELSPERRQQIRERIEKSTQGPWGLRPYDVRTMGYDIAGKVLGMEKPIRGVSIPSGHPGGYTWITTACEMNAEFIAAARQDVPDLLAALEQVEQERDEARKLAREATNGWATYATRRIEHDDIRRLHNALDALKPKVPDAE